MRATTNEHILQILQADWQQLLYEQLETWQYRFDNMVNEEQELRRQGQWISGPADLLSILSRSRRELDHCTILAWLMNPCAPHGLSCYFLTQLLSIR